MKLVPVLQGLAVVLGFLSAILWAIAGSIKIPDHRLRRDDGEIYMTQGDVAWDALDAHRDAARWGRFAAWAAAASAASQATAWLLGPN